jgi:phosphatidylserine decarboxylase
MFKIHKEGHKIFTVISIILFLIGIIAAFFFHSRILILLFILIFLSLCILFIAHFFRIPNRNTIFRDDLFYSPADGKIVVIEETFENEYLKDKRLQVSIFMSVWDVHINFFPCNGKVIHWEYHPGKFLVARHPKSSTLNERTTIVIENENQVKILLRQIAGIVARRIVCKALPGLSFKTGDELGFIKFGSRVDIFFPPGTKILVKPGEQVYGSLTPIAAL